MTAIRAIAADDNLQPERRDLSFAFLPITCATPIIVAKALGFYEEQGLNVELLRRPAWAVVRDLLISEEIDGAHMLATQPLAGAVRDAIEPDLRLICMSNKNGSALTMHIDHKDNRNPKNWKGFRFGIPFDYSIHNLLLRHYLALHGLDPDRDVSIRVYPPPEFVANLAAGNLDGGMFAEPFNQRAVWEGAAYIHTLSRDLMPDHPCCGFVMKQSMVQRFPQTAGAIFRAIASAGLYADKKENRSEIAEILSKDQYLGQPLPIMQQVMSGRYADGLGEIQEQPQRISFHPFPQELMAVWLLEQMKRWNLVEQTTSFEDVASAVFDASYARDQLSAMGIQPSTLQDQEPRVVENTYSNSN
ncbi:ABC transporter substrate-binding protein [Aquisalimonas sp. 2447]|uniref:ABC transporter substrate-binding protein n=1 Tax=Aquisalimonas sp. 2447 TaxID=2740807 RepID=UPI0014323278|nr:ABC transporter substrate-binding protein [Aquisalimonas sp. 2447]QIT54428.1 ABC transporter substrate-binding protein [Aquisalimonas sp. 2447]